MMRSWVLGGILAALALTFGAVPGPAVAPASAQTTMTLGSLADPSHEAILWGLRNGKGEIRQGEGAGNAA
jgi:hypothetical protein